MKCPACGFPYAKPLEKYSHINEELRTQEAYESYECTNCAHYFYGNHTSVDLSENEWKTYLDSKDAARKHELAAFEEKQRQEELRKEFDKFIEERRERNDRIIGAVVIALIGLLIFGVKKCFF